MAAYGSRLQDNLRQFEVIRETRLLRAAPPLISHYANARDTRRETGIN